jgi:adhesin transport system outer membrane protein
MPAATVRQIRALCVAALAIWLAACLAGPTMAAESAPDAAVAAVARRVGLCQCLDDKTSVHLRCMAGAAACQNACASAHYGFLPLGKEALRQCQATELYVVLPNADGRPGSGAIRVEQGGASTLLDAPYAAAAMLRDQKAGTVDVGASEVYTIFGPAIDARPLLPSHFTLLYPLGSVQPLPESTAEYRKILDDIKRRPIFEVQVIGYTDTIADPGFDQRLGMQRADGVRRNLIRDGVAPSQVSVTSRGKSDLVVPTPDQVAEQRNRRVEVTVR